MVDKKPIALVILDGFGYSPQEKYNAIAQAKKPHLTQWLQHYPHYLLKAAGSAVGLLPQAIGNSEVGHLTIGAGRSIKQISTQIIEAIDNKSFFNDKMLHQQLSLLEQSGKNVHIIGLLSDGGVHCHEKVIYACLELAQQYSLKNIFVHTILDGRDVAPQSAQLYLQHLEKYLKKPQSSLASLHGRFYAMDRDHNWERTHECYKVLTELQETRFDCWQDAIKFYYDQQITDEFIPPTQLHPHGIIQAGDGIIFGNYRPDRARQLTQSFVQTNFKHFATKNIPLSFLITPVEYDKNLVTTVLYQKQLIFNTLKDMVSQAGKTIFSIAETEKYAHVTYFFTGGREDKVAGETRVLIPSIITKTYEQHPCMSAPEITHAVLSSLQKDPADLYIINYANADMVGHSGNLHATIQAIECLDGELKKLYDMIVEKMNGMMIITGDHGNAEEMYDAATQQPKTAHTNNPVYCIVLKKDFYHKKLDNNFTQLADIAPFILRSMNLPVPTEMKS